VTDSRDLLVESIHPNPDQPRKVFAADKLQELADSMHEHGVLEPLVVTKRGDHYLLVCGERRWRAAKLAGLTNVPCTIRKISDRQVQELALLENIQREDLTAMEQARAYQDFIARGYTVETLAKLLGFSGTKAVTGPLRLLNLRPRYQEAFEKAWISHSQATHLSKLEPLDQDALFRAIRDGKCDTEEKLKAVWNALVEAHQQPAMFEARGLDQEEQAIADKYGKLLDRVTTLLRQSFKDEDLTILKRALQGDVDANIERVELIIQHLGKIKKALQGQAATQLLIDQEVKR